MDQNEAAIKALTMVHKNRKKIQICIPQDRVTPCSSMVVEKTLKNVPIPITASGSGTSSFEEGEDESFVEMSSAQVEPMDTTESLVTAVTNKSASNASVSGGESALIQIQHSRSGENSPANSPAPQRSLLNPADFEVSSASDGNGSVNTSTHILSTQSSDAIVAARMPSVSTISSSEIVGMELSPSVPAGRSFTLPPGKDNLSSVMPVTGIADTPLPGEFRNGAYYYKRLFFCHSLQIIQY